MHSLPHQQSPPSGGAFVTADGATGIITQSPQFTLRLTLMIVHLLGLGQCMSRFIHHCGDLQGLVTALKSPRSTHPPPPCPMLTHQCWEQGCASPPCPVPPPCLQSLFSCFKDPHYLQSTLADPPKFTERCSHFCSFTNC